MDYTEVFNQVDREISQKIESLQKKQEQLLEQKKFLLEAKQKIHGFLSDAYEVKRFLDFNVKLQETVKQELIKIFTAKEQSKNVQVNNSVNNQVKPASIPQQKQELEPELVIDNDEQEPIKIFKFVDSEGKDASF